MAAKGNGEHRLLYWFLKYVIIGPALRVLNRPEVEGVENIPKTGPALLAGNHLSIADWLVTPLVSPRRISYLAKNDYFIAPGIKGVLQRFFFLRTGHVPIDRSGGDAAEVALKTAKRLLSQGRIVSIYPEGTRSPDGRLYKGRTGLARISMETGAPIIPVAVIGTDKVSPPGPFRWRPRKITVKFSEPIYPDRYNKMGVPQFAARALTDHVMYELMNLTGQSYVDEYAKKRRDEIARDATGEGEIKAS